MALELTTMNEADERTTLLRVFVVIAFVVIVQWRAVIH